jgi:hypothetical protein
MSSYYFRSFWWYVKTGEIILLKIHINPKPLLNFKFLCITLLIRYFYLERDTIFINCIF